MTRIAVLVAGELPSQGPRSAEDLEQDVLRVMDALEGNAGDLAIGPSVACNFETSSIDVRYSVEADTSTEIHQRIAMISEIVEHAFQGSGRLRTSMGPSDQVELACA